MGASPKNGKKVKEEPKRYRWEHKKGDSPMYGPGLQGCPYHCTPCECCFIWSCLWPMWAYMWWCFVVYMRPEALPWIESMDKHPGLPADMFIEEHAYYDNEHEKGQIIHWWRNIKGFDVKKPSIIFMHGFPTNHEAFDQQMHYFLKQGKYNVISQALRGQSYKKEPAPAPGQPFPKRKKQAVTHKRGMLGGWFYGGEHPFDISWDVGALIDDGLKLEGPIHLVGHDLGSLVLQAYAQRHANTTASISLLGEPKSTNLMKAPLSPTTQLLNLLNRWYSYMFMIPNGSGERWLTQRNHSGLEYLYHSFDREIRHNPARIKGMKDHLRQPSVMQGTLIYYTAGTGIRSASAVVTAGAWGEVVMWNELDVPTLTLHGERDGRVHPDLVRGVTAECEFPGDWRLEMLPEAGHFLHITHPDEVNKHLDHWISTHPEANPEAKSFVPVYP